LFSAAFSVNYTYCIVGMAVLTGIYVILGGYVATAINDFVQARSCWWASWRWSGRCSAVSGFMAAINKLSQIRTRRRRPADSWRVFVVFRPDPMGLLAS
jgi:SSS family solute:Na+ symporter